MRITLELEPADIERFTAQFDRVRSTTRCVDEVEVIDAVKYALDHLQTSEAPTYVRKRLVEAQRLIVMLEDSCWALADPERSDVIGTLAYFGDPDDLIPDHVAVVGLLDDAILLELLLRRLRRVNRAYADFCAFRAALCGGADDPSTVPHRFARELAERRAVLHLRMRGSRASR
ncbi:MAG: YkvA family protein [Dokdonella sp.]|uniref:YkvA family protein n=1 Tax=Dokdonella sp. TaxID=2291710 RepID=UPI003264DB8C